MESASSILALLFALNNQTPSDTIDRKPAILHEPSEVPQGADAQLYQEFEDDFYR